VNPSLDSSLIVLVPMLRGLTSWPIEEDSFHLLEIGFNERLKKHA